MHTIISILILAVLAMEPVRGQMLSRLLLNEIEGNAMRTEELEESSEATENAEAVGVPYVGGSNRWRVPLFNASGFTTPTFVLDDNEISAPDYAIFAIEIQNNLTDNACNRPASQLARIQRLGVTIGLINTTNPAVNVSSYLDGNDHLNLQRMGLSDTNNLIRFNIPRMDGDVIQFNIVNTNPDFDGPNPLDVCLQVEFLGVRIPGNPSPPRINENPLLQYNMFAPSFTYLGNFYDDVGYDGVKGSSYTGGALGVLTDRIIGTDPRVSTAEWVGFQSTGRAGIRLFLDREYAISDVTVYFWMDTENGAVAPTGGVQSRGGQLTQFTFDIIPHETVPNLYMYTGITSGAAVTLDYLMIPLVPSSQGVLITEIVLLDDSLNEIINTSAITLQPDPTGISSSTNSPSPSNTANLPPPTPAALSVDTIVFAVVGVVGCCCASLIVMVVSGLLVVMFVYLRKNSKRRQSRKESSNSTVTSNTHLSLARRLSDKYLPALNGPSYSQFRTPDTGDYANADPDNLYQQVDRPLPLPPVPGQEKGGLMKEDSYIEMSQFNKPGLTIDVSGRKLRAMRTLSEDDYMPVTPPSVPSNVKQPPQRLISATYVDVTPPHSPIKPVPPINENDEAVPPPESTTHNLEFERVESEPNQYV